MDGWSPVGGQVLSAYVKGGIVPGDKQLGHSVSLVISAKGCQVTRLT